MSKSRDLWVSGGEANNSPAGLTIDRTISSFSDGESPLAPSSGQRRQASVQLELRKRTKYSYKRRVRIEAVLVSEAYDLCLSITAHYIWRSYNDAVRNVL